MRKVTLALAACSTAIAAPAVAREGQPYIEFGFGPLIAEDMEVTQWDPRTGVQATFDGDGLSFNDMGYDGAAIIGYDWGGFRTEIEAAYRKADFDAVTTNIGLSATAPALDADVSTLSFMGNILADFGPDDGVQFFFGVGGGAVRFNPNVSATVGGGTVNVLDGADWEFAWQGIAGLRAPINDNIDVSLRYRYFHVDDWTTGGENGSLFWKGDFTTHSLLGTVAFNFGAPPPAPVVAPPPPPPPPPPPSPPPPRVEAVCSTGPYIVFFNWDKSDITPEAATILDNAVSAYSNCGTAAVMLAGHTDTSGSTTYNMGLAERRNASVRGYLTSRGIPDGRITSEAFGESQLRVPTADGVRELQNRRVEITYGPGSGM